MFKGLKYRPGYRLIIRYHNERLMLLKAILANLECAKNSSDKAIEFYELGDIESGRHHTQQRMHFKQIVRELQIEDDELKAAYDEAMKLPLSFKQRVLSFLGRTYP